MKNYLIGAVIACVSLLAGCKKEGTENKPEEPVLPKTVVISTVAGNGTEGFSGDGASAILAQLYNNRHVAVDAAGNIYIADTGNRRIRKVSTSGTITTVAGNGNLNFSGDGGPATAAGLDGLEGITLDAAGNIYAACSGTIRKISTNGIINTVAGGVGFSVNNGDGGPATSATLAQPQDVAVDAAGNIFIADWGHHRVRKVSTAGIITTVAGNGGQTYNGDGISAVTAALQYPIGLALDGSGKLYISSQNRIRMVDGNGVISTVAGTGTSGFSGDGALAVNAKITPVGIAVDKNNTLFIADYGNGVVRKVASGMISTVAGGGKVLGDGGLPLEASLIYPTGIAVDGSGNLFIADYGSKRVRKVTYP